METGSRFRNVAGAVLVGGASSRMSADKAALELGGVALATRCADTLAALVEDVVLVGGAPPDAAPGRRVPDPPGPRCALRGLVGALAACDAPRVLVLATDLPFVTRDLLLALIAWPEADVVAPRGARGPEPLCALYRRAPVLALARHALEAERLALHALLDALDTRYLEGADLAAVDPERRALTNLNSPDDLALAERTLSAPAGRG